MALTTHFGRANRAQYGEVSFRVIPDDETVEVALPSMQGLAEDEGEHVLPIFVLKLRLCNSTSLGGTSISHIAKRVEFIRYP